MSTAEQASADAPASGYHAQKWVTMTVPLVDVLTEESLRTTQLAHFVEAPQFTKHLRKEGIRMPSHFLFALFVLYQRFAAGREYASPLWQARPAPRARPTPPSCNRQRM